MAKQSQTKNRTYALWFTAFSGMAVGLFAILGDKVAGQADLFNTLQTIALVCTVVGGIAMGLLLAADSNK